MTYLARLAVFASLIGLASSSSLLLGSMVEAEAAASDAGEESSHPIDDDLAASVPSKAVGFDIDDAAVEAEELADTVRLRVESFHRRLPLLLSGNLEGNFAAVDCRKDNGHETLYWAKHVAYHEAIAEVSERSKLAEPVALKVGNSLFPGPLGRYLTHGLPRGDSLADLMARIPFATHGVGLRELSVPTSALVDFSASLRDGYDIDVQAANLDCDVDKDKRPLCDTIVSQGDDSLFEIVDREGIRIAVTTVLAEELFDQLASFQTRGLEITDPVERLSNVVGEMNEHADLVVVQYQVPSRQAAPLAYDLASAVEGIDLMVTNRLLQEPNDQQIFDPRRPTAGSRTAMIEAASTGTPIVGANSGAQRAVNVELDIVGSKGKDGIQWAIRAATPRTVRIDGIDGDEDTTQALRSRIDEFCDDWGDPISEDAVFDEPFETDDMQTFVLNVMRFSARAEVALSNRGAFRNEDQFPLTEHLTRADVYATLPYDNRLVIADVKGSVLEGLSDRLGDDVVGAGIDVVDDGVVINGRSPDSDRVYRVALNDFLAAGGDGVFSEGDIDNIRYYHPRWSDDPPPIGDIVIGEVQSGEHIRRGAVDGALSAEDNFPDLHQKLLWNFTTSINAAYNQVAVENPTVDDSPAYDQSQLTVQSTDQINVQTRFVADADSRNHGWKNELNIHYATARITDEDDAIFETTRDQVRLRSRYRYKRLRADQAGVWYVPDPVMEGQAESEFRGTQERDWRRLDLRAIAGASFQLFDPLDVRFGANMRHDINEPGGRPTWGLNLSYTLERITPFRIQDRPIRLESEVEYFYNDIGNDDIHEVRSSNRIFVAMFDQFFFTTSFNAFLYRDDPVGQLGSNTELTIGINYQWETARQNF